jgi:translocation and assembly module TamB
MIVGAIGGQVYSRIKQIDQQEDERNRQVFSLLVLNRFFPDSGSDGSGGGAMALARNNLNQALSDQLNGLSDRLLGKTGLELDFGLNSYTDYQGNAPQDRTQLDITAQKKLFDDRLILSVGSEVDIQGTDQTGEESTPVIGNVAIEYLITEDGRFRVKGFRKNQYENVIDGQIFVNGIAFIFSKEFNKYKDLFKKEVKEEKPKRERRKRKRDNNNESGK